MLNYIFKSNREVIIIKTNETQDKNIFLVKNNHQACKLIGMRFFQHNQMFQVRVLI